MVGVLDILRSLYKLTLRLMFSSFSETAPLAALRYQSTRQGTGTKVRIKHAMTR